MRIRMSAEIIANSPEFLAMVNSALPGSLKEKAMKVWREVQDKAAIKEKARSMYRETQARAAALPRLASKAAAAVKAPADKRVKVHGFRPVKTFTRPTR